MRATWVGMALASAMLLQASVAMAGSDQTCRQEEDCRVDGECSWDGDACIVGDSNDCRQAEVCLVKGRCSAEGGRCVAATEYDCRASLQCEQRFVCYLDDQEGKCVDHNEDYDTGMVVGGGILVGVGGASVLAGAYFAVAGALVCNLYGGEEGSGCRPALPVGLIVGGLGVGVGAGLPLLLVGGKDVPPDDLARPQVSVGPTGGSLRWRF